MNEFLLLGKEFEKLAHRLAAANARAEVFERAAFSKDEQVKALCEHLGQVLDRVNWSYLREPDRGHLEYARAYLEGIEHE